MEHIGLNWVKVTNCISLASVIIKQNFKVKQQKAFRKTVSKIDVIESNDIITACLSK